MSEQTHVYIRHAGWIDKIEIKAIDGDKLLTERNRSGIEAVCHPGGACDIRKFDLKGNKVYDGFGMWNTTKIELPTGVRIRISKDTKIWNVNTSRHMILATSITIYADEDLDEMEYIFKHDLYTCTVGMENASVV